MNKVEELLNRKRLDIDARKKSSHIDPARSDFPQDDRRLRLSKHDFHLFAEIKRASLSAGSIRNRLNPATLARSYAKAGISLISILTEEHFFHGSLDDLSKVRKAVAVPLLQKDFIVDEFQILEAKQAGADFVLLIARFLGQKEIMHFLKLCDEIKINALVEITDESDLAKLDMPVQYLGVNSRDLETLEVDPRRFEKLRKKLPDTFLVAESGITSFEALFSVHKLGYNAALVGEYFLRQKNPGKEAATFLQAVRKIDEITRKLECGVAECQLTTAYKPLVKICGITSEQDALLAIQAGAHALGFVFAKSPRRIDPEALMQFRHHIPPYILCVGVFREQSRESVQNIVRRLALDAAQVYEPMRLPVPTWHARVINSLADISNAARNQILWDIKVNEAERQAAWKKLSRRKVFAMAGDLNPENVSEAISICKPEWVDVARGVEKSPGMKDEEKLRDFIRAVQEFRGSVYHLTVKT